jgi:hypothetical protein
MIPTRRCSMKSARPVTWGEWFPRMTWMSIEKTGRDWSW